MLTLDEQTNSKIKLAQWATGQKKSTLQSMLVASARPDILSFALGLPAAELFPAAHMSQALTHVLDSDPRALQYSPPLQALKTHVVALMKMRGVPCREGQVFLTSGAQQGLSLLVRLLLDPGGTVVLEEKVYTGLQQALNPLHPHIITVPTDLRTGIDVTALEDLLRGGVRPALLYCVTDGNNPMAVSMSREKRQQLIALARSYQFPIIEDDPYGFLQYEDSCPPPLRAHDEEWVCYVGTFSKILAPALRTGWMVVPEYLIPHLAIIKESSDIDMAPLNQRAISHYLDSGHFPSHLATLRREYRRRRDAMLRSLAVHFPEQARWQTPSCGLFIWVELPEEIDSEDLFVMALETEKVAFIPGHAFDTSPGASPRNCIRLNFSNSTVEQIEDGIARLGRAAQRLLAQSAVLQK
jgi:2-aminoadipate transaminase